MGVSKGKYTVDFVNGESEVINVERLVVDTNGVPIFLEGTNKWIYNWGNIIAIRKKE